MEKSNNWKVAALEAANNFNGLELAFEVTNEQGKYLKNHYDAIKKWCKKTLNKTPHTIRVLGNVVLLYFEGDDRVLNDAQRELAISVVDDLIDSTIRSIKNVSIEHVDNELIKEGTKRDFDDLEKLKDIRMEIESEDDEFQTEWLRLLDLSENEGLTQEKYNKYIKELVEDNAIHFYVTASNGKQLTIKNGYDYEEKDMLTVIDYFSW